MVISEAKDGQRLVAVAVYFSLLPACLLLAAGVLWICLGRNDVYGWCARVLVALYAGYVHVDRSPRLVLPSRDAVTAAMRPWARLVRQYFPIDMLLAEDNLGFLDRCRREQRPLMIASHPHGIFSTGACINFAMEPSLAHRLLPGVDFRLATLELNFKIPLLRELLIQTGFVSVSQASLAKVLAHRPKDKVPAAIVVVGGAREALFARPRSMDLVLKDRVGFFRLAIQNAATVLPTITFGENDLFNQMSAGPLPLKWLQDWVFRTFGFSLPWAYGRFGLFPMRSPLITVIGRPIEPVLPPTPNPTCKDIADLGQRYIDALADLYNSQAQSCLSYPPPPLKIL